MIARLRQVLRTYDPAPLEIFLGGFTGLWGLWLLLPWQPATFAVGPAFAGLVATGVPEEAWGAVACLLGLGRLLAVAYDIRRGRERLSLGAFVFWLIVSWYIPCALWHGQPMTLDLTIRFRNNQEVHQTIGLPKEIGTYVYEIQDDALVVYIVQIGDRKEVYRRGGG